MHVTIRGDNGLLIVPDTEFEENYLSNFNSTMLLRHEKTIKAWVKHGVTGTDVIGLVIEPVPIGT